MDEGTRRDYIEDLKVERALLLAEIDQLRESMLRIEAELKHSNADSQRYASDYFHWRSTAESLQQRIKGLEAERDQWQRLANQ